MAMEQIVAMVGPRNADKYLTALAIHEAELLTEEDTLISGGAPGIDSAVESVARRRYADGSGRRHISIPFDSTKGKAGGLFRNTKIVDRATTVRGFWNAESRGTRDTLEKAYKVGKLEWVQFHTGFRWFRDIHTHWSPFYYARFLIQPADRPDDPFWAYSPERIKHYAAKVNRHVINPAWDEAIRHRFIRAIAMAEGELECGARPERSELVWTWLPKTKGHDTHHVDLNAGTCTCKISRIVAKDRPDTFRWDFPCWARMATRILLLVEEPPFPGPFDEADEYA